MIEFPQKTEEISGKYFKTAEMMIQHVMDISIIVGILHTNKVKMGKLNFDQLKFDTQGNLYVYDPLEMCKEHQSNDDQVAIECSLDDKTVNGDLQQLGSVAIP